MCHHVCKYSISYYDVHVCVYVYVGAYFTHTGYCDWVNEMLYNSDWVILFMQIPPAYQRLSIPLSKKKFPSSDSLTVHHGNYA